jgi:hypothetical protein
MAAVPWLRVPGATGFVVLGLQVGDDPSLIMHLATQVGHLGQQLTDLRPGVSLGADARWSELISRFHHHYLLHPLSVARVRRRAKKS